jgi:NADPH:quinone reductase-like Zn-dependent oxidoreductase
VGSFAIQYAKAKGAYVYTTTSTSNLEWVKKLGADRVIDYKTEDYKSIVKDVDIVFDTLGKNYSLESFDVVKQGGIVVSVVGPLDEASAKMFGMADYKLPEELAKVSSDKDADYKFIFMIIDKVYPFSESFEAFEHLATGRAKGKIVVKIS